VVSASTIWAAREPRPVAGVGVSEVGGEVAAAHVPVLGRVDLTRAGVGVPAVDHAAREPLVPGLVAEKRHRGRGLHQRLPRAGDDHRGRVRQPVEYPHEPGVDVVGAARAARRRVAAELEQVVALIERQAQPRASAPSICSLGCGPRCCSMRL
jgi:hypothetical protein